MNTVYDPASIEKHWYQIWENLGCFQPSGKGQPYCIMLPPPNVTGTLHMGHGFQQTLMDVLIRFHRMSGFNTLWQVGTDHAGIATQMVVERLLQQEGKKRHEVGRTTFIKRVWDWKNQSDNTIKQQMRRLGASADWQRERFTMDESISLAVVEAFVRLYEQGLIYRGKRLVNWDPLLHTAISDLEVVTEEQAGSLWHIRYPLVDNSGYITIATTRPETLFGDTAVVVNPEDERYQHVIGKKLLLPLVDREIPIIADISIDKAFGSGAVKVTPAHDFHDYALGHKHHLPFVNIFTADARMNENVPEDYQGLDRFQARKKVINELEKNQLLEKIEPHLIKIPKGDRSGAILEPYLTDQWFMAMKELAQPAITAVQQGAIHFIPENWSKIYFQWLGNIEDWCISRQLWWGHRIPAWYDPDGNIYVGHNEADVRKKYNLARHLILKQDEDVLDTWFSSALWPFATLGWPEKTAEFSTFYPTQILVTGFDIIFFWVARMVMLGLHLTGKIPFHEVYITGLIRDSEGQKMSKSKGNIIDPIDLIDGIGLEELLRKRTSGLMQPQMAKRIETATRKEFPEGIAAYGVDALRFTYCALASQGRELRFDLARLQGYRNFCNKIWNAARYVLLHAKHENSPKTEYSLPDRWIRSSLQNVIRKVYQDLKNYRFDFMAHTLYEFIWNEYCDWYLEFSKPILNSVTAAAELKQGTRNTLIYVLESFLRLMHPVMPFITEEIWQQVAPFAHKKGKTILLQPYPQEDKTQLDINAEEEIEWLKGIILAIRNMRGEMHISPKKEVPLLIRKANHLDKERLEKNRDFLKTLAKLEAINILKDTDDMPATATAIANTMELHIPLADLIDKDVEIKRLQKEIDKNKQELNKMECRLKNADFLAKAPAYVVAKEQMQVNQLQHIVDKLQLQLQRFRSS